MHKTMMVYGIVFNVIPMAVIVGLRFPFPRWFLGSASPPPGNNFVVVLGDQVTVIGDNVVVPTP